VWDALGRVRTKGQEALAGALERNQLERLAKEVRRRTKVVEVFWSEDAAEKLLYLVLSQLDEA